MHAYRVSEEVFQTGVANEGEYVPIPAAARKPTGSTSGRER